MKKTPIFPEQTERTKVFTKILAKDWWKKIGNSHQDVCTRQFIGSYANYKVVTEEQIVHMYKREMNMFAGSKLYNV